MRPNISDILDTPSFLYSVSHQFFRLGITATNEFFNRLEAMGAADINTIKFVAAPAVNIAFALELALKGLLQKIKGQPPKGHSLVMLYKMLSHEHQQNIQEIPFHDEYSTYRITQFPGVGIEFNKNIGYLTGSIEEVLSNLELQDKAFIDFRYMNEMGARKEYFYFYFLFMANFTHNCLVYLYKLIMKDNAAK